MYIILYVMWQSDRVRVINNISDTKSAYKMTVYVYMQVINTCRICKRRNPVL